MTDQQIKDAVKKAFAPFANYDHMRPKIEYNVEITSIGSWVCIEYGMVDVEGMESITRFIRKYFTPRDTRKYMYLSVNFGLSPRQCPAILFDLKDAKEIFG